MYLYVDHHVIHNQPHRGGDHQWSAISRAMSRAIESARFPEV